ncbi:MAG: hypothetical protein NW220_18370 [Leptolyngbyaceae cyanobacterium bins.349]|nr:hypothetical protein [Leptolyngbyaceae cyanobacterium bins.349]
MKLNTIQTLTIVQLTLLQGLGIFTVSNQALAYSTESSASTCQAEWEVVSAFDPLLLKRFAQRYIPNLLGAVGRNQEQYISVEFQRHAAQRIIYGLLTENPQLIEESMRSFEYAFSYQNQDGSFQLNYPNAKSLPKTSVIASATSGFLSDFGHSLLLLQQSSWFLQSLETQSLRTRLEKMLPAASLSLSWLTQHHPELINYHAQTTNLLFMNANTFYLMGKAFNNSEAMKIGEVFTNLALQQQDDAGFFMEKGGPDSSYQGVSLYLALLLYTNLLPGADNLKQNLWQAIGKGINWEYTKILPSGEVSTEGNTRIYPGGEVYFSQEKGIAYNQLILALLYYSEISNDSIAQDKVNQIRKFKGI